MTAVTADRALATITVVSCRSETERLSTGGARWVLSREFAFFFQHEHLALDFRSMDFSSQGSVTCSRKGRREEVEKCLVRVGVRPEKTGPGLRPVLHSESFLALAAIP